MGEASARELAGAMAEVARALRSEASAQDTLQKMVDLAVTTIRGCDHAGVSVVGPDHFETPAASDVVPVAVDRIQYDTDQGPCLDAIREQDVYMTGDLRTERRWPAFATRATRSTGVRSMLSLRLFVEDENLGALNLYSRRPHAFDEESMAVGRLFAAHAAVALSSAAASERSERRADRYERQAQIAVHLQRSLLTELPAFPPFSATARYVPAVEAAEIGGDWYDALVLPSGDLLLVVGDLTGHDIDAATAMAQTRTALRVLAMDHDESPSELLTRLDDTLDRLGQVHVGSCAAVRISRRDGEWYARLASAGHPPPLVITRGAADFVDMRSDVILGVELPVTRHTTEFALPPGTTLLLYTDGLVERRDLALTDGMNALRHAAEELHDADVDSLCDALLQRLASRPTDDVCLLAAHLPAGSPGQR